jgi:hypothetical protein
MDIQWRDGQTWPFCNAFISYTWWEEHTQPENEFRFENICLERMGIL